MDEMIDNKYDIFVDIDAIMDTRLPILHAIDTTTATKLLSSGEYFKRKKDVFGVISNDIFNALYGNRTKETLLLSGPSYLFDLLITTCVEIKSIKKSMGDNSGMNVYLNIYPYELSIIEQENLTTALGNLLDNVKIIPVSMSIPELTPEWVKSRIGTIIKYDSLKWLEYHMAMSNMFKNTLITTTLYAPAIISGNMKSREVTADTFDTFVSSVSTIIDLNMLQVKQYCFKPKKEK